MDIEEAKKRAVKETLTTYTFRYKGDTFKIVEGEVNTKYYVNGKEQHKSYFDWMLKD